MIIKHEIKGPSYGEDDLFLLEKDKILDNKSFYLEMRKTLFLNKDGTILNLIEFQIHRIYSHEKTKLRQKQSKFNYHYYLAYKNNDQKILKTLYDNVSKKCKNEEYLQKNLIIKINASADKSGIYSFLKIKLDICLSKEQYGHFFYKEFDQYNASPGYQLNILTEPQREFIFKYIYCKTEEEWQEYKSMYDKVKEYFI